MRHGTIESSSLVIMLFVNLVGLEYVNGERITQRSLRLAYERLATIRAIIRLSNGLPFLKRLPIVLVELRSIFGRELSWSL